MSFDELKKTILFTTDYILQLKSLQQHNTSPRSIAETVPAQRCFVVFMAFHNFSHRAKKEIKQMEFKDFPTSLKEKNPNTFRRKEGSRFDELKMEEHHMNPFTMIFRLHSIFTSALSHNVSLSLTKRKPLFLCSSKQNQSIFFFFSDLFSPFCLSPPISLHLCNSNRNHLLFFLRSSICGFFFDSTAAAISSSLFLSLSFQPMPPSSSSLVFRPFLSLRCLMASLLPAVSLPSFLFSPFAAASLSFSYFFSFLLSSTAAFPFAAALLSSFSPPR
ncbi:hypothetical protein NE237_004003 [Protea cynaroides]|uniref:Uncharacterized protein n=1 Tax=Protea cynaroides TaxID=273540 RepID=A0A9Q0QT92_9MAGN|nr:hypothetical protein NE237_004003 [Protea cynaroides]